MHTHTFPKISKAASAIGNLQRPDKAFPSDFHTFLWPLQEIHSPGYLIKCWLAPICTRTSVPKLYQLAAVSTSRVYMVNAQGVFTPELSDPLEVVTYSVCHLLLTTEFCLFSLLRWGLWLISYCVLWLLHPVWDLIRSGLESQLFQCLCLLLYYL